MKADTKHAAPIVAIALPPIAIALVGLTHPHHLEGATAQWWVGIHLVLLPLFPLLGAVIWVLLRGQRGVLPWLSRATAFLFIPLYTALDAMNGIAAGALLLGSGEQGTSEIPGVGQLAELGGWLGTAGAWSLLASAALAATVIARARPTWLLFAPGALGMLAGIYAFSRQHVYWPWGALGLLAFAIGAVLLELSARRARGASAESTGYSPSVSP